MKLGSKLLKEWRIQNGFSQSDVAVKCGVAQPTYWAWERDSIPKIEQGATIEQVTGGQVPISSWATEAELEALEDSRPSEAAS
jgi:transcriptional regulator with XRE-family HTH domain